MKVLVTGGAGYIGSHMVRALGEQGHRVLVYDNLSRGHKDAVLSGELVIGDLSDKALLRQVIFSFKPDVVMHFAAFIDVAESTKDPLKYYFNNTANTINLLNIMADEHVNKCIFSSTAAVYGNPEHVPIQEGEPVKPVNPYGYSKSISERVLSDLSNAGGFNYVSLRYFNAAGAEKQGRLGERHDPETHLIPLAIQAALGKKQGLNVYGTDYPTQDGTCIRDYIHIDDLVNAHILALEHLMSGGASKIFNCGYGHGFSVREIINTVKKVTGNDFPTKDEMRRPGDPAILIADNSKIRNELNWMPRFDDLDYIIRTAWEWERKQ